MNEPPSPAHLSPLSPAPAHLRPGHPAFPQRLPAAGHSDEPDHGAHPSPAQRARHLHAGAIVVLSPVALIAAALSFQSLHEAATKVFGPLALGFPLLVDMLILGSTLEFLAGATLGRPLPGWRWTAHTGVGGTLLLNALAASGPTTVAWHITPALVWSILVEMTARQVTGHGTPNAPREESIPIRIWLSTPRDAARTWLYMARTGQPSHRQARADLAVHAAAHQALRTALPHRRQRAARRLIHRQLRAGALDPAVLLDHLRGRHHDDVAGPTVVVIEAFLDDNTAPATTSTHPHPQGRPPASSTSITSGSSTSPTSAVSPPPTSAVRPAPSPRSALSTEHHRERLQAAIDILRTRPDINGAHLAREFTDRGWPLSARTARRVLAEASQGIATTASDARSPMATDGSGGSAHRDREEIQ